MAKKTKTLRISETAEKMLKKMAVSSDSTESAILDAAIKDAFKKSKLTLD